MDAFVLTYEGFVGKKSPEHLMKEVAIAGVEEGILKHNIFRLPYSWDAQTYQQK